MTSHKPATGHTPDLAVTLPTEPLDGGSIPPPGGGLPTADRGAQVSHQLLVASEQFAELERGWRLWRLGALRTAGLPFARLAVLDASEQLTAEPGPERDGALRAAARAGFDALLDDDRLRAAMTWQNPETMRTWAARYAAARRRGEQPSLYRLGQRAPVVARYAARYAAKNDTIGFFGPVAWVRLDDGPTRVRGTGAIRDHAVSFEVWAIQAIARAWASDPAVRPHLPVRLDPSCTRSGGLALRPQRAPLTLTRAEERLIDVLCRQPAPNGGWALGALLAASDLPPEVASGALKRLTDQRVVQVGFRIPICGDPERHLAAQLAVLPDRATREVLGARLAELDDARRSVARDITDAEAVLTGLAAVDARLETAAGVPVTPGSGLAPGGRTPVYVDCRGDLDAVLGPEAVRDLATPLSILLDSARWLAGQVGESAGIALSERYRRLAARRAEVTLADLQLAAADVLVPGAAWLADVVDDFHLRWAEILAEPGDGRDAWQVPVEHARRLADALFPTGGRVWAAGRVHAPDLMLRRTADGGLGWVLGELHVALNTLESRLFAGQADDPGRLVSDVAASMPPGRVVPVYPSSSTVVSSRSYPPLSLDPPGRYRYWSYGSDDGHPSGAASVPGTALIVTEQDGDLVASCAAAGWAAPVVECFGEFLSALVVNLFRLRPPRPYAPRIDLGALTLCRRTWRVALGAYGPLRSRAGDPGQDQLRGWAAAHGLPRRVFVRMPSDPKPFYVDFAAPLLVDNLVRVLRRAAGDRAATPAGEVEFVEMLPGPDELWLRLPDGSAYTSELRLVAVDPIPAPAPSWRLALAESARA